MLSVMGMDQKLPSLDICSGLLFFEATIGGFFQINAAP